MSIVNESFFKKRHKQRNYLHFDKKRSPSLICTYVLNPSNIIRHSFYPFISYNSIDKKITRVRGYLSPRQKFEYIKKPPCIIYHSFYPSVSQKPFDKKLNCYLTDNFKSRNVSYASHFDSDIYAYYSKILEIPYEEYLKENNLEDCALAYRKIKRVINGQSVSKCNIHFSKDVFDSISIKRDCIVLCFDVKGFFDSIDHHVLKNNWCHLVADDQLPPDHYKVFKSLTKFASVDKEELYKELKLSLNSRTLHKRHNVLCSSEDFRRRVRGKGLISTNNTNIGIPQGSPISGLLSNIYMMQFDKVLNDYLNTIHGKYFRYSDDMIFVVDKEFESEVISLIKKELLTIKLSLNNDKTQRVEFKDGLVKFDIKNISYNNPSKLQYLGLLYDGDKIFLRETGLSKYYRKMRKAVRMRSSHYRRLKKLENLNVDGMYMRTLHTRFTYIGKRNYISYVFRAANVHNSRNVKQQVKGHYNLFNEYLYKKR